ASFNPWRNERTRKGSGDEGWRNPTTGIAACCACAADGHTAAPATSVMNSRRLIVAPRVKTTHRIVSQPSGSWNGVRGARTATNCSGLGMSALSPTTGVKTGKAQNQQTFSSLPPKADLLPILKPLLRPALRERRHRGLARRQVAVRAARHRTKASKYR